MKNKPQEPQQGRQPNEDSHEDEQLVTLSNHEEECGQDQAEADHHSLDRLPLAPLRHSLRVAIAQDPSRGSPFGQSEWV